MTTITAALYHTIDLLINAVGYICGAILVGVIALPMLGALLGGMTRFV